MATILILEPDEQLAAALSEAIEQAGMRTIVQEGSSGVVDLLTVDPPALIILDLAIDDDQGVKLCHEIRDSEGGELLPILMLGTGEEGVASFGDALSEGGDYYFSKPVEPSKVISKIRTYVGVDRDAPAAAVVAKSDEGGLAERVEQMMDLGETFKDGLLAPPEGDEPDTDNEHDVPKRLSFGLDQPDDVEPGKSFLKAPGSLVQPEGTLEGGQALRASKEQLMKEAKEEEAPEAEDDLRRMEEKTRQEKERKRKEEEERKRKEEEKRKRKEEEKRKRKEEEHLRELEEEERQRAGGEEAEQEEMDDGGRIEAEALWEEALDEKDLEDARKAADLTETLYDQEPVRSVSETMQVEDDLVRLLQQEANLARDSTAAVSDEFEEDVDIDRVDTEQLRIPAPSEERNRPGLRMVKPAGRTARTSSAPRRPADEPEEHEGVDTEPAAGSDRRDFFEPAEPPEAHPPETESWDLSEEMVPAVLWRLYCQQVTGMVVFQSGADSKEVFLERGVPIGVRSSQTADRLEEMLFREGLIDREAYAEARVKGISQPRALAAHLVERGMLRPEELFPLVRRHLEFCLLGLFEWREGSTRYEPRHAPDAEKVRLARPMAGLLVEGIRRKFLQPRMMSELGGPSSLLATIPPEDRSPFAPKPGEMGLTNAEREVLRLVDGMRPIEEIVFLSGQGVSTVYRVLLAAVVTGLVAVAVRGLSSGPDDPTETRKRAMEISRRRLESKFEKINRGSYFEILGVSEQATRYEIQAAYDRLIREFHPVNFSLQGLKDLAGKLEIVQRTLAEARDVLSDELLREGYRAALKE